jgi:8-hydroxy-5-deazaflavin:NADPH oxidoreductase
MKVAVLGGTGKMGSALARHLSKKHQVIIGSRDPTRGEVAAKRIPGATGTDYLGAASECDVAIIALPFDAIDEAVPLADALEGKLVISIINPVEREGEVMVYPLDNGSAAEMLASILSGSEVATAFNNIPERMLEVDEHPVVDVLVAASSRETYDRAAELVSSVPGFRPLYAGGLANARLVEELTVIELNMAKWNGTKRLAPKFVSQEK